MHLSLIAKKGGRYRDQVVGASSVPLYSVLHRGYLVYLCQATGGFLGANGEQTVDAWRTSMEVPRSTSIYLCGVASSAEDLVASVRASAESLTIRAILDTAIDARLLEWYQQKGPISKNLHFSRCTAHVRGRSAVHGRFED